MTEGGRPAHRRERGKYPLRGNLHTEGGLQRDLHAKRRGDYPLRGNLHKQGGGGGGDNPAQKAREVCKQRKRHTCQTKEMKHQHKKGRERPKQRKRNLQWRERTWTKGKPTQGTQSLHTKRESRAKNLQTTGGVHTYTKH